MKKKAHSINRKPSLKMSVSKKGVRYQIKVPNTPDGDALLKTINRTSRKLSKYTKQ